jgi:hypothetical protein
MPKESPEVNELEKAASYERTKIKKNEDGSYYNALGEIVGTIEKDEDYDVYNIKIRSINKPLFMDIVSSGSKEEMTINLLPELLKSGYEL